MAHDLWIVVRIVSGLWLLMVFNHYAVASYRVHGNPWSWWFAFATCCLAFLNAANWI